MHAKCTSTLAVLGVIAGIAAGLRLVEVRSLGVRPLNWLIIFIVDLFRALAISCCSGR